MDNAKGIKKDRYNQGDAAMPRFCVSFFNKLLSSDGHPFKALQRVISVEAESAADAARIAEERFARVEDVEVWKLHAQFVEVRPDDTARAGS